MTIPSEPFPIGHHYLNKRGGGRIDDCEVIDHLTTYNSAGEAVAFRYVAQHTLMGQTIVEKDVVHTTIAMRTQGYR